jgi:hypothetical protein
MFGGGPEGPALFARGSVLAVPLRREDLVRLRLSGDGAPGLMGVLGPGGVRRVDYPAGTAWSAEATVRGDGTIDWSGPAGSGTPAPGAGTAASLTVAFAEARRGDTVEVAYRAPAERDRSAWVGLIPANVPHGAQRPNDNADVVFVRVPKEDAGVLTIRIPPNATPGGYQFRMFPSDQDRFDEVASTGTFAVR